MSSVKQRLKQIAAETAMRSGVRAVTLRELGAAVGIKSSSVAYHFGSKQGLLREVMEDYRDELRGRLRSISTSGRSASRQLASLVDVFEEALADDKLCLGGMLAAEVEELDETTRQLVRDYFDELERWVVETLRAGGTATSSARPLAKVIVSGLQGALLMDKAERRPVRLPAMRRWIVSVTR